MRLKEIREAKGLKQREVADFLNCSQTVYSRYETSKREPPNDILILLASFYGVSVDYLLGREEDKNDAKKEKAPADKRAEAKAMLESMNEEQYQEALRYLKYLDSIRKSSKQ